MKRTKITISLNKKAVKLIDDFKDKTSLENRSRVIDQAIFTIAKLLSYKEQYQKLIQETGVEEEPGASKLNIFILMDMLSKWSGILDVFEEFPVNIEVDDDNEKGIEKKYRRKKEQSFED